MRLRVWRSCPALAEPFAGHIGIARCLPSARSEGISYRQQCLRNSAQLNHGSAGKTGIYQSETPFRWPGPHGLRSTVLPNWAFAGVFHSMRPPPSISAATQPRQSSVADRGETCREASAHSSRGHGVQTPVDFRPQAERPRITSASAPRHVSKPISLGLTF